MTKLLGEELGPYRVESEIGCGAMGTVFSATVVGPVEGLEEGTRVALKVVHAHLLSGAGYLERFLQEVEVGRTVRHPNVVRTFEANAVQRAGETIHFLVMEYVEGENLRQFLREFGTVPEAILREIALQTAAGLAAIHAHRIVHRDIKPENILITDDHEIRIMDLGVAKVLEATLSGGAADQFAGSMLYGAPEQFGGIAVGPAADLYSLGATLYELATGEHPFRRDTQAAVIDAHLHHTPPLLADRSPELTPFFSELVAKLVAKNPENRFASAQALNLTLQDAEGSTWWRSTEPERRRIEEALPKIPVRRETELHGREDVLESLHRAWAEACKGHGSIVFVEGEAGVGKTRVLDAFARGLADDGLHILYGSYPPSGGLGGVSDAILGKFGEEGLAESIAPYLTQTPALVPSFASLVMQGGPPSGGDVLAGSAITTLCVHLMHALATEKPLLWLVDDLHFAPSESRELVLAMARAVAGRPVLLVVTARPGLPDDEMAHLAHLEHYARLPLRRLGAREVVELLRSALQSDALANKLGGTIAYKSDGVPFFIFEMIRGLEQGQFIKQLPDGSYVQTQIIEEIQVPSAVKDLIEGRLGDLDKEQRAILDVGSVQGLRFDPALVAEVLEMKRVHVLQDIAQIERRTGLVRGAVGAVEFDQHQIQEVLHGALMPDLRKEYHSLLATAFAARLRGDPTEAECVFLATHYLEGSEPERGMAYLLPALDQLATVYRNDALIVLAGRALDLDEPIDASMRVDILLRQANRLGLLGRREHEYRALTEAAVVADDTGDSRLQARARLALARYLVDTSRFSEAIGVAEDALALAPDSELEGGAEGMLGLALLHLSRFAEARPHFERRLEIACAMDDPSAEAFAEGDLGLLAKSVGGYAEAREHFERMLAIALATGDPRIEANAAGNLGTACKVVGRFEEARGHFERQRELSRQVGDRMGESNAAGNLGLVLKNLGRIEEARTQFEECREISREIGNPAGEARVAGHLGLVEKGLGHFKEARTYFERSRDLSRELEDVHGEVIAIGNIGNVLFDLGRYEEALAHYDKWRETACELGDRPGETVALGNLGNALEALGRLGQAYDRFDQSHRIACEIGDREGGGIALADLGALISNMGAAQSGKAKLEQSLAIMRELGARRSEGYALQGLGRVAAQVADVEEARRRIERAREVYRAIHYAAGVAETELALGRLDAEFAEGRAHLERALTSGRTLDMPSVFVRAACLLATADAAELLDRYRARMSAAARLEAHFVLWKTTGDEDHLARSRALLAEMQASAPEEYRDSMVNDVPLHRHIVTAG